MGIGRPSDAALVPVARRWEAAPGLAAGRGRRVLRALAVDVRSRHRPRSSLPADMGIFAVGVALGRKLGYSRRVLRASAVVGTCVVAAAYALGAWLAPELDDRYLASRGAETEDMRQFGPRTPVGIVRNIRFVEASPPEEYSLRASTPDRFPPNVLRWDLHVPVAFAAFGLINLLIGVHAAELTADMTRGNRRNTRVAIGVLGGMAFFACHILVGPVESFLRDGAMRSGVAAAWTPLALPAAEALLLAFLARARRYG